MRLTSRLNDERAICKCVYKVPFTLVGHFVRLPSSCEGGGGATGPVRVRQVPSPTWMDGWTDRRMDGGMDGRTPPERQQAVESLIRKVAVAEQAGGVCVYVLLWLISHPFYDCFCVNATTQSHRRCVRSRETSPGTSVSSSGSSASAGFRVQTHLGVSAVESGTAPLVCVCPAFAGAGLKSGFLDRGLDPPAVVLEDRLVWIQPRSSVTTGGGDFTRLRGLWCRYLDRGTSLTTVPA